MVQKCAVTQQIGDVNHQHLSLQWLQQGEGIPLGYSDGGYHMPTKMVRVFSSVDAICIYLSLIQGSCIEVTCGLICFRGYVMGMQINAPGSA